VKKATDERKFKLRVKYLHGGKTKGIKGAIGTNIDISRGGGKNHFWQGMGGQLGVIRFLEQYIDACPPGVRLVRGEAGPGCGTGRRGGA
jgi:hypothetical protein